MNEAAWAFWMLCVSLGGAVVLRLVGVRAIGPRMLLGVIAGSAAFIYLTPAAPIAHAGLVFGALAPWTFAISVPSIRGSSGVGRYLTFGVVAFVVAWILSFLAMGLSLHPIARSVMLMQARALPDYVFSIFAIGIFAWFVAEAVAGGGRPAGAEPAVQSANYVAQITLPFLISAGLTIIIFFNPPNGLLNWWLPEGLSGRSLIGYRPLKSAFTMTSLVSVCLSQLASWYICVFIDRSFVPGRFEHHLRFAAVATVIAVAAQIAIALLVRDDGIFASDELRRTIALSVPLCLATGLVSTSLALLLRYDRDRLKNLAEASST